MSSAIIEQDGEHQLTAVIGEEYSDYKGLPVNSSEEFCKIQVEVLEKHAKDCLAGENLKDSELERRGSFFLVKSFGLKQCQKREITVTPLPRSRKGFTLNDPNTFYADPEPIRTAIEPLSVLGELGCTQEDIKKMDRKNMEDDNKSNVLKEEKEDEEAIENKSKEDSSEEEKISQDDKSEETQNNPNIYNLQIEPVKLASIEETKEINKKDKNRESIEVIIRPGEENKRRQSSIEREWQISIKAKTDTVPEKHEDKENIETKQITETEEEARLRKDKEEEEKLEWMRKDKEEEEKLEWMRKEAGLYFGRTTTELNYKDSDDTNQYLQYLEKMREKKTDINNKSVQPPPVRRHFTGDDCELREPSTPFCCLTHVEDLNTKTRDEEESILDGSKFSYEDNELKEQEAKIQALSYQATVVPTRNVFTASKQEDIKKSTDISTPSKAIVPRSNKLTGDFGMESLEERRKLFRQELEEDFRSIPQGSSTISQLSYERKQSIWSKLFLCGSKGPGEEDTHPDSHRPKSSSSRSRKSVNAEAEEKQERRPSSGKSQSRQTNNLKIESRKKSQKVQ